MRLGEALFPVLVTSNDNNVLVRLSRSLMGINQHRCFHPTKDRRGRFDGEAQYRFAGGTYWLSREGFQHH